MINADVDEEMLLVSDAVRFIAEHHRIRVVKATVRLWIDTGKLPARRSIGGVRLIRRKDLEEYMKRRQAVR